MRSRIAAPHYPCTAPLKPSAVNNPDQRLQCLGPTAKPCLPIRHSLPNVSPLELLPSRADLAIRLQAAYDEGTFLLREETRGIREVLDDEEREYASYDGDEALYDENPGPATLATDTRQLRQASLAYGQDGHVSSQGLGERTTDALRVSHRMPLRATRRRRKWQCEIRTPDDGTNCTGTSHQGRVLAFAV